MVETQFFSLGKHGLYTEDISDQEGQQCSVGNCL